MPVILCIETSTSVCSIALIQHGSILTIRESSEKNSHAALITTFIEEAIQECGFSYKTLDAVAVGRGPGSYTGLRIGVSTAKGLCYALDIPLISIDTLRTMAKNMAKSWPVGNDLTPTLFCPMLDARRMEVYTALYNQANEEITSVSAMIVNASSFSEYLENQKVIFFGDGAEKCKKFLGGHPNARFPEGSFISAGYFCEQADEKYSSRQFEEIAYFEPYYLKDFIPGIPRVKGLH